MEDTDLEALVELSKYIVAFRLCSSLSVSEGGGHESWKVGVRRSLRCDGGGLLVSRCEGFPFVPNGDYVSVLGQPGRGKMTCSFEDAAGQVALGNDPRFALFKEDNQIRKVHVVRVRWFTNLDFSLVFPTLLIPTRVLWVLPVHSVHIPYPPSRPPYARSLVPRPWPRILGFP